MEQQQTLSDRIGGMAAVNAAVDIFYPKVLADETLSHFFTNVNMATQAGKQKAFLAYSFGAPMAYSGKKMSDAHTHMNLTAAHFNAVAGHLVTTLQELQLSQNLIDEVVLIAMTTKDDIVTA